MSTCCCCSNPSAWRMRPQRGHLRVSPAPLGFRPARQPFRAHARRMRRGARPQHRAEHQPARPALPRRRPRPLRRPGRPPAALHPRQPRCRWCATWRSSRASATPSTPTRSITWSRTSRRLPAACAITSSSAGWRSCASRRPPSPTARVAARPSASWRACAAICTASRGRDNNVLTFDAQDAIAEQWQLPATPRSWMREYYRHARAIYRAAIRALEASEAQSSSLFAQFRDWRSRLSNADFSVHRERAHFRAPQRLDVEPELVLRLFEFVARHGIRLSSEAEQRIEARLAAPARRISPNRGRCGRRSSRILSLPHAPAGRARHARNRRAHRSLPRAGADRVPGDPRFLPPLHRGRAHPGGPAESVEPAPRRCRIPRSAGRDARSRPCCCSRCCSTIPAKGTPRRRPRGRLAAPGQEPPWRASRCRRRTARSCCS